jgi:hypothetical protein
MPGISPSGIPRARCSTTPFGGLHIWQVVPSVREAQLPRLRVEHAVEAPNIFGGMSGQRTSLTRSNTSPGETSLGAAARKTLRVEAIIIAAGTPLSVTSPTAIPTAPSGSSMKS